MNSGMYAAVSGDMVMMQRMDVITNNLANVNTVGFKKDRMNFVTMLDSVKNPTRKNGTPTGAPVLADYNVETDYSPGALRQSGNPLDLALDGNGFFVLDTPRGQAYTRQGNFHLDSDGRVVSADGYVVQGNGGPITIKGGRVEINDKGEVSVDGDQVATLKVVDFPRPYQLQKIGSAMFQPTDQKAIGQPATGVQVRQGELEDSNVQTLIEMATLIETSRMYESCVKTIQSYDDMANKAANDLGRV
ncbi:MAG TPA: flagellar basal-body rod protein FlgF [Geobacteraceae bacterium]|nr:flagellar basal-body rod protein FlgF [Geobacteraceae bacterium]